ncbi:male sterility protein-domain-containing protein [Suillus bovinus]|uniref:male sterility protein-domain-containing protein n=1 Tax=Suillus bovinus TaxID=48563 RepID=UPI001B878599|nr:male sterility protein-domain-containing protein [Suillus bovinus]KAG2145394.1 male sterility protein-domain-containing protein [Suillus bovinus]
MVASNDQRCANYPPLDGSLCQLDFTGDRYEKVEGSARAGFDIPLPTSWTVVLTVSLRHCSKIASSALCTSSDRDVQASGLRIDPDIIFSSPSIHRLAESVIKAVLQRNGASKADIENMIERYSVGLGNSVAGADNTVVTGCSQSDHVVVLTGSTGGLGSYLLADLLQREDVSVVHALNRPSKEASIQQRQEDSFKYRGFEFTLLQSDKLVYVETDTSADHLGLDKELYQKICTSATVIIHNAWTSNLNAGLSSFDFHVRGTRNLRLGTSPHHPKPRFMFTSSMLYAQSSDRTKGPLPGEVQYDAGVAAGPGYGASKYISGRVLVNSKLPSSSFRIGHISGGPPRGVWSTKDWLPVTIASSVSLGALPEAKGVVSWIPPHAVSNAILDVAFAEEEPPIVVDLRHPRPVVSTMLIQSIADALFERKITSYPLPLVPFSEWFEKLESSAKGLSKETLKRIPAIKLLNFLRFMARSDIAIRASGEMSCEAAGMISLTTAVAERISPTMKELKSLSSADAAQWVDYWTAMEIFQ